MESLIFKIMTRIAIMSILKRKKDVDGDGIPDSVECPISLQLCPDADSDGIPDYLDPDSDGDGIPDATEKVLMA